MEINTYCANRFLWKGIFYKAEKFLNISHKMHIEFLLQTRIWLFLGIIFSWMTLYSIIQDKVFQLWNRVINVSELHIYIYGLQKNNSDDGFEWEENQLWLLAKCYWSIISHGSFFFTHFIGSQERNSCFQALSFSCIFFFSVSASFLALKGPLFSVIILLIYDYAFVTLLSSASVWILLFKSLLHSLKLQ